MNAHHYSTRFFEKFLLLLVFGLSASLACSLSPFSTDRQGKNNQPPTTANQAISATTEAFSADGVLQPTGESMPAEAVVQPTAVPSATAQAEALPQASTWSSNWLHFGVDQQFSSYNANETVINRENIAELALIHGSGCEDATFTMIGGTPALYHGRIILTYPGGNLEAGNPYTGDLFWGFGEQAYGWAPPPVVSSDGVIYYTYVTPDASSRIFAVEAETGQMIWEAATQFKTGFTHDTQLTVDEKNGLVYVLEGLFGDGRLYALDQNTGEVLWTLGKESQLQDEISLSGSIVPLKDDKLFVQGQVPAGYFKQSQMVRIDVASKAMDLTYDLPAGVGPGWNVAWYGLCQGYLIESYRENGYLGPATVLAAHATDQRRTAWQANIPGQSGRLACDAQKGLVYIPTDEGLLALRVETGEIVWNHPSIKSVFTPTIANGIIYYISDSNLYALDQEDGSQLFRYPLGSEADPSTGVAVNDGLVIFSGSGGTCDLYVLGLK